MSNELTKEEENRLNEAFFLLDQDNDNSISINEIGLLLRALGIFISESEIQKLKSEYGAQGNLISYDKFKKIYIKRLKNNLTSNDLYNAFRYFDNRNCEKINLNSLKHGLMTLGEPLSAEEMKILEDELNLDENGDIDYKELSLRIYGDTEGK